MYQIRILGEALGEDYRAVLQILKDYLINSPGCIDENYRVITLIVLKIWYFTPLFGELCIILITPNFHKYYIYIFIKDYNLSRKTIG